MMIEVGIVGSGAMGSGIAQVAATAGHKVVVSDTSDDQIKKAKDKLEKILHRLAEKGKISEAEAEDIFNRIRFTQDTQDFKNCGLVIEAIVENMEVKTKVFQQVEAVVDEYCILASNTSSLSIAAIGSALKKPERVIGIHFFNPAPLMPLVEIIPAVQSSENTLKSSKDLIDSWKKVTVIAKDTPGFIVNRVARPFYGEALRMYEEGVADFVTIDYAMTEYGKFRMGPFTLMDFIGNDVNYKVTESVFEAFYYDPRYRPAFTQKRMMEAGYLGKKTGRGYYNYAEETQKQEPKKDEVLCKSILNRILVMLINEAADALYLNIASKEDIDSAMTKGVNYPKGLLQWADEIGIEKVLNDLDKLYDLYREDRYRASVLLRRMVEKGETFYG